MSKYDIPKMSCNEIIDEMRVAARLNPELSRPYVWSKKEIDELMRDYDPNIIPEQYAEQRQWDEFLRLFFRNKATLERIPPLPKRFP